MDDEGVPSVGFAATFDINQVSVSAAVFIDSVNPQQSLFAAALSGFSFYDIATCIANQAGESIPSAVAGVLKQFKLTGTETFYLPIALQGSLDKRDLRAIAAAFANSSQKITLPSAPSQVLLDVNTQGMVWYLTDLTTRLHYSLHYAMNSIVVQLEPQFYFAPQNSNVGALTFPQGFYVHGELDLLVLKAAVDVQVESTGLTVEIDVEPVIVWNKNFFALTGSGGVGGPHVSIATMSQPQLSDSVLSQPHVVISGEIKLLGVDVSSTYLVASASGLTINTVQEKSLHTLSTLGYANHRALSGFIIQRTDHGRRVSSKGSAPSCHNTVPSGAEKPPCESSDRFAERRSSVPTARQRTSTAPRPSTR